MPLAAGALALGFLARALPDVAGPSPGETLARLLDASARAGKTIAAAGYWGPELDYRLARAGAPGRVVLFPSAVAAHPGWYREEEIPDETLAREADALLSQPSRPSVFVLPRGSRASAALATRLGPARRLLRARSSTSSRRSPARARAERPGDARLPKSAIHETLTSG